MEQTYKDTRARRRASEKAPVAPTKQKVCVANLKSLRSGGAAKNEANAPSSSAVGSAASDVGHSGASSGSSTPHSNPPAWNPDMPITGDTPATLGASYPVGCLPDHRGPDFDHRRSVVPQHEVWSLQNRLIHPRDLPFHLKPGVLLLIEGKFCVWHTPGGESLVQFVTDAVKIIADSNEDPELPSTDITATPSPRASAPSAPKRTAAFAEFGRSGSSSTPCKRPKIDDSDFDIASAELGSMGLDDDADRRDEKKQANGKAGGSGKGKGRAK
ncbi:hypothetical protein NMY22_g20175 [Coprinellus aureogranulatus]|nr:hypothetical protein NMY22_g20175 [Coprinellus aureogranulatus]